MVTAISQLSPDLMRIVEGEGSFRDSTATYK